MNVDREFVGAFWFLMLIIFSFGFAFSQVNGNTADEGSSFVLKAEYDLRGAFEAVLEAERAGANVSVLVEKLNEAGRFLAEAENALRGGNFSEAVSEAGRCSLAAEGIVGEALSLKSLALVQSQRAFRLNLAISVVTSSVFIVVLFFVWRWFKGFYVKKLLRMKPEVVSDVEA